MNLYHGFVVRTICASLFMEMKIIKKYMGVLDSYRTIGTCDFERYAVEEYRV